MAIQHGDGCGDGGAACGEGERQCNRRGGGRTELRTPQAMETHLPCHSYYYKALTRRHSSFNINLGSELSVGKIGSCENDLLPMRRKNENEKSERGRGRNRGKRAEREAEGASP